MKIGAFHTMDITHSGLQSERKRLFVTADNIVNRETTRTQEGGPYVKKMVTNEYMLTEIDPSAPKNRLASSNDGHLSLMENRLGYKKYIPGGVNTEIVESAEQPLRIFDPDHPDANEEGYVLYPDIDLAEQMAEAITAVRAYEANVGVMNGTKYMIKKALTI